MVWSGCHGQDGVQDFILAVLDRVDIPARGAQIRVADRLLSRIRSDRSAPGAWRAFFEGDFSLTGAQSQCQDRGCRRASAVRVGGGQLGEERGDGPDPVV